MQFLVIGYDSDDPQAPARRMESKAEHLELGRKMIRTGHVIFSTAILDDDGEETIGSMRVMNFESRAELDVWLDAEPYVKNNVWQDVQVRRVQVGPSFEWMTLEATSSESDN